jgi:Lysylphosphatidylglycerol synthase TM region
VGKWVLDYLALLTALAAVGAHPRPSLVLLAYLSGAILGMVPITPGGLGFVEAGLTTVLVLAGGPAGDASLAVLAYRLVSHRLPFVAGALAILAYRTAVRLIDSAPTEGVAPRPPRSRDWANAVIGAVMATPPQHPAFHHGAGSLPPDDPVEAEEYGALLLREKGDETVGTSIARADA